MCSDLVVTGSCEERVRESWAAVRQRAETAAANSEGGPSPWPQADSQWRTGCQHWHKAVPRPVRPTLECEEILEKQSLKVHLATTNKDSDESANWVRCTKNKHYPHSDMMYPVVMCKEGGSKCQTQLYSCTFFSVLKISSLYLIKIQNERWYATLITLRNWANVLFVESTRSFVTLWPRLVLAFCFLFLSVVETKTHLSKTKCWWYSNAERAYIKFHSTSILLFCHLRSDLV